MKIFGWNCRDICNALTVNALRASIKVHNPDIIFLSETKASKHRINRVASLLGFPNYICVEAFGKLGGICLFWPQHIQVEVFEFDPQLIAVSIHSNVSVWNLVGFYSPPQKSKRRIAWENLHALLESLKIQRKRVVMLAALLCLTFSKTYYLI